MVPNDVELNNDLVELILVPKRCGLNNDRGGVDIGTQRYNELILVPNDVIIK